MRWGVQTVEGADEDGGGGAIGVNLCLQFRNLPVYSNLGYTLQLRCIAIKVEELERAFVIRSEEPSSSWEEFVQARIDTLFLRTGDDLDCLDFRLWLDNVLAKSVGFQS